MSETVYSGKYEVQEQIAQGGMGMVCKALDRKLNRVVAIKVIHTHLSSDPAFLERFLREARAMARLHHDNIVTIFSVEQDQTTQYLVMEYFQGSNLRDVLKTKGSFPLRDAVQIIRQLAQALAYAHTHGIIHRDIKPANVLLDAKGKAKLTDFGIAAALDDAPLTSTGQLIGTLPYMSPEQARDAALDGRSDLYSLGLIFYELLVGVNPRHNLSNAAILGTLLSEEQAQQLDLPASIPPEIQRVVTDLLRYRPTDRIQDADTLVAKLDELRHIWGGATSRVMPADLDATVPVRAPEIRKSAAAEETVAVLAPPPQAQRPTPSSRNGPLYAVLALAGIAVFGGAYYLYGPQLRPAELPTAKVEPVPTPVSPPSSLPETVPKDTERQRQLQEAQQQLEADLRRLEDKRQQAAQEQEREEIERQRALANRRSNPGGKDTSAKTVKQDPAREAAALALEKQRQELAQRTAALEAEQARIKQEQSQLQAERARAAQQAREEADRRSRDEADRKSRDDAERKSREEAEQRARDAADRKSREEADRRSRVDAEERKSEALAKERQEQDARRLAQETAAKRAAEEQERKTQELAAAAKLAREQEQAKAETIRAEERTKAEADKKQLEADRLALEDAKRRLADEQARLARERETAERAAREAAKPPPAPPPPPVAPPVVASIPVAKPDSALMDLLEQMRRSLVAKDLPTLEKISKISESRRRMLEAIFDNYASLDVTLGEVSGTTTGVVATLQINKLIRANGDTITPNPAVRKSNVIVPRDGDGWGRPGW